MEQSMSDMVLISLPKAEALVLFEMLSRYDEGSSDRVLTVNDYAERHALWKLHGYFQRELVEPLLPNYDALLASAKASLTFEGSPPFEE
jgi:hypothetical protein